MYLLDLSCRKVFSSSSSFCAKSVAFKSITYGNFWNVPGKDVCWGVLKLLLIYWMSVVSWLIKSRCLSSWGEQLSDFVLLCLLFFGALICPVDKDCWLLILLSGTCGCILTKSLVIPANIPTWLWYFSKHCLLLEGLWWKHLFSCFLFHLLFEFIFFSN